MTRTELARLIYQTASIRGTFKLRSGQMSNEYFDKYLFESEPTLLDSIATEMQQLIPPNIQYIAGLELGGIPIATMLSHYCKIQTLYIRKKPKAYGTCKLIEGGSVEGKSILIIEDIVTSAGAIIDAVYELRKAKATVKHAICVIDRESGGRTALNEIGVDLLSLFSKHELEESAQ